MSPRTRRLGVFSALLVSCSVLVVQAPSAQADPPSNDDVAQAEALVVDQPSTVDLSEATLSSDPREIVPCRAAGREVERTVWFELTPATDQRLVVQTLVPPGRNPGATSLTVWTGPDDANLRDLSHRSCGQNPGGARHARVVVDAVAGEHYYLQVGAWGDPGPFEVAAWSPPSNDDRASAETLTGASGTLERETLRGASIELRESTSFGNRSVWYRWTAPDTGHYRFDTNAVDDTKLATGMHVYAANRFSTELRDQRVVANDPPSQRPARVGFLAAEGQEYLIAVRGSAASLVEDFALAWAPYEPHETRLSAMAEVVQPGAARITAEVERVDGPQAPLGLVRVLEDGFEVASADLVDGRATVELERLRGVHTYTVIFVRSTLDDVVPAAQQVTVDAGRGPGTPPNDDVADATEIAGPSGASTGATLVGATREGAEPVLYGDQRGQSVWWRWTAPATDTYRFTLSDVGGAADDEPTTGRELFVMGLRGDLGRGPRGLRDASVSLELGADRSTVEVAGVEGRTYHVVADVLGDAASVVPDDLTLAWEPTGADPGPAVSLTAESTGPYEVALTAELGSEDTNAYVYFYEGERVVGFLQANALGGLTLYDRGHEPGETTYHVEVYPYDGSTAPSSSADVAFTVPAPAVPGNDRFADAAVLAGAEGTTTGTTAGASPDAGAEVGDLGYPTADRTVWYRWVAPADGPAAFRLDRLDQRGDPVLRLYESDAEEASSPSELDLVGVNDDVLNTGSARSEVRFAAVGGRTYYVAVDAYSLGTTGAWDLSWRALTPSGTSTVAVDPEVDGRDVVLATDASSAGRVVVREGGGTVAVAEVGAGDGQVLLGDVAPGAHEYSVTLVPDDVRLAPSTAAVASAEVFAATRTTITAPRRARAGDRPTIRVTVRGIDALRSVLTGGKVRIAMGSRVLATRRLEDGRASLRLPALRAGRAQLRVTYLGTDLSTTSSATRTIVVKR